MSMLNSFVCVEQGHTMAIHNRPSLTSTHSHLRRKGRNNLAFRLLEKLLGYYTRGDKQLCLFGCLARKENRIAGNFRELYSFLPRKFYPRIFVRAWSCVG